jgi:hypothetical protein
MAPALETAAAPTAAIYFELDRFEVDADGDRLTLSGRWFGVRGRRFVRPTLTLSAAGLPQRLLADMEHKPWAASDGEAWVAAFAWDLDSEVVTDLELGVAPDIAVALPPPGAAPQRTEALSARPAHRARDDADERAARLLEAERRENERLRSELSAAGEASVQTEAAIARRDAALSKADDLSAQLDEALRERDQALAARDEAVRERDAALKERDASAHSAREHEALVRMTEQLTKTVAALEAQLQDASAAAQRAEAERRQTLLDLGRAQVGAAARSALQANPPVARRHFVWRPASGRDSAWSARLLALAVLIGALVALAVITHVL